MLKVILMRHAAAQLEQYGKNDRDRTISMEGMHELDALRSHLKFKFDDLSLVYCSNVKRTRQTLEGIRQFLPHNVAVQYEDSLYQASADSLWHKVQTTSPSYKTIMIIGHNPALSNLLSSIQTPPFQVFPTAGIVMLTSTMKKWHEVNLYNVMIDQYFTPNSL